MKIYHLFLLGCVSIPGLALVAGTKRSGLISRNTEGLDDTPENYTERAYQYDRYLPELPAGWPNMTAVQELSGSSERRDLTIRPSGDVTIRSDPTDFGKYISLGWHMASWLIAPVNWYGMITACEQFAQQVGSGFQCVTGAITEVMAIATIGYQVYVIRGTIGTRLSDNGWYVPGINKRDEWVSMMARELSDGLGTEVRHLGMWNGTESNQKRDSEPAVPREVFGLKRNGHDYHFTYMGRDAEGKDSFKLGLGDGSINKERRTSDLTWDNYYFSSGGIDFEVQSVLPEWDTEWSWGGLSAGSSTSIEFEDMYNAVNCYIGGSFTSTENAISFQVYDSYRDMTLSAGIMSPYSATEQSAIRVMELSGGIGSTSCGAF